MEMQCRARVPEPQPGCGQMCVLSNSSKHSQEVGFDSRGRKCKGRGYGSWLPGPGGIAPGHCQGLEAALIDADNLGPLKGTSARERPRLCSSLRWRLRERVATERLCQLYRHRGHRDSCQRCCVFFGDSRVLAVTSRLLPSQHSPSF